MIITVQCEVAHKNEVLYNYKWSFTLGESCIRVWERFVQKNKEKNFIIYKRIKMYLCDTKFVVLRKLLVGKSQSK